MSARSVTGTRQHLERHQFESRPAKRFACHCLVFEFLDVSLVGTTQERRPRHLSLRPCSFKQGCTESGLKSLVFGTTRPTRKGRLSCPITVQDIFETWRLSPQQPVERLV